MRVRRKALAAMAVAVPLVFVGLLQAQAQQGSDSEVASGPPPVIENPDLTNAQANRLAARAEEYWTPAKMRNAEPMEATAVVDEEDLGDEPQTEATGEPGYAPGFLPGEAPKSGASASQSTGEILPAPQHGTAPSNPQSGPYGPFQRYSYFARFLNYPISTIGKLFFSLDGGNFVCSASVIGLNAVITAGHCNSNGSGGFATNRSFCPSFNASGVNPATGCWGVVNSIVAVPWHNGGDPDYDYAVLRAANTGSVHNTSVGNVTGGLGHSWNFSPSQAEAIFGYPAGSPFTGNRIIQANSTEWYNVDFTSGTQVSKAVGNDMTPGSSGGPWILGLNRANEVPDTDGSNATDPGSNWVNGVNSHKRCLVNCSSPPTATQGVFWQEMTSPPFLNNDDPNDAKSIIDIGLTL